MQSSVKVSDRLSDDPETKATSISIKYLYIQGVPAVAGIKGGNIRRSSVNNMGCRQILMKPKSTHNFVKGLG